MAEQGASPLLVTNRGSASLKKLVILGSLVLVIRVLCWGDLPVAAAALPPPVPLSLSASTTDAYANSNRH